MRKILVILVMFLISASCTKEISAKDRDLTICISDPDKKGIQCSFNGKDKVLVPYEKTENFICMPFSDAQRVLIYQSGY